MLKLIVLLDYSFNNISVIYATHNDRKQINDQKKDLFNWFSSILDMFLVCS